MRVGAVVVVVVIGLFAVTIIHATSVCQYYPRNAQRTYGCTDGVFLNRTCIVDYCTPFPCFNANNTCLPSINAYTCVCGPAYTGLNCSTCALGYCWSDTTQQTCTDQCLSPIIKSSSWLPILFAIVVVGIGIITIIIVNYDNHSIVRKRKKINHFRN